MFDVSRYGLPNPGYVGADQIVELPKQPKEYADKLSQTLTSSDEFTVAWITAPNEEAAKSLAGCTIFVLSSNFTFLCSDTLKD